MDRHERSEPRRRSVKFVKGRGEFNVTAVESPGESLSEANARLREAHLIMAFYRKARRQPLMNSLDGAEQWTYRRWVLPHLAAFPSIYLGIS